MAALITRIRTANGSYSGDYIMSAAPTKILGKADVGSPVTIIIRDEYGTTVETFETTTDNRRFFRFEPGELPDGAYSIEVTALSGGVPVTEVTAILVDTVIEAPVLQSVTPETQGGNEFLKIAGTAEANAIVTLFAAGVMIGTAQADENGLWEMTVTVPGTDLSGITLEATDAAGNTASTTLEDDTENPVFEQGQSYTYDENQAAGDVLATVAASDNVGIVSYVIVGGNEQGWFEIDVTGAIRLTEAGLEAVANDFETGPNSFVLTIRVTDATGNTTSQQVTLNVQNTLETVEEVRKEIYEDSSSDGGPGGSNNGVVVDAAHLGLIANDVFRFSDQNSQAVLEDRFQEAISQETGFSNLPTDAEIQALVDEVNKDLSWLFRADTYFNESYVVNWDVSNVENMSGMFFGANRFNQDISGWDVSNVKDMSSMFVLALDFNQDIGSWNVGSVETMQSMFSSAKSFNQDIGGWDVSNVTDMKYMFHGADAFNKDIGGWDVSNVKTMLGMFAFTDAFNQDISRWDVSNVTNTSGMFFDAKAFNQDIGAWDVSKVGTMSSMFAGAKAFNQDISGWDISSLKNARDFLNDSAMSTENFDKLLAGWGTLDTAAGETTINTGVALGAEGLTYTDVTSKNHLEQTYGWTVGGSQAATDSDGRTIFAGDNTGTVIDLSGESQAQAIHGLDGNDTILGTAFDDLIVGGAGNDVMTGGAGADKFVFRDYGGGQGDFGHDTITDFEAGAGAGDVIRLELTGLTNFADLLAKASDTTRDGINGVLIQIDADNSIFLEGLTVNDLNEDDFEFLATDSQTFKLGSDGGDTLAGDDHNNRIDGRSGDDTLTGGAGADTFVFKEGYGNDTITDFSVEDLIEIDTGLADDFAALQNLMRSDNGGADTVIDLGNGNTLTLEGVSLSELSADQFSFLF